MREAIHALSRVKQLRGRSRVLFAVGAASYIIFMLKKGMFESPIHPHVLHIHVPKTAGTKLLKIFEDAQTANFGKLCFPTLQPTCCFNENRTRVELSAFIRLFKQQPNVCDVSSSEWSYGELKDSGVLEVPRVRLITFVRDPFMLVRSALEHDIALTRRSDTRFTFYESVGEKLEMIASNSSQRGLPVQNPLAKWILPEEMPLDVASLEDFLFSEYFFIGVQEHLEHSICLLRYKLKHAGLRKICDCAFLSTVPSHPVNYRTRDELTNFTYSAFEIKALSNIIKVDRVIYALVLRRFIHEIDIMQRRLRIHMLDCMLTDQREHAIEAHMCRTGMC